MNIPKHPDYLAGRLEESLKELGRRIDRDLGKEALERQLARVQAIRAELMESLKHYAEAVLYEDLKESINARIKTEAQVVDIRRPQA